MKTVLLSAGRGLRLGVRGPKCLARVTSGETIFDRQVRLASSVCGGRILAVVGHEKENVMKAHPEIDYVVNSAYERTNTAHSLALALRAAGHDDVLWMNGDVVFDEAVLRRVAHSNVSAVAVNRAVCGSEEMKYTTDAKDCIRRISKTLRAGEGEALGVNLVRSADLPLLARCLARRPDGDYFERAMEDAIAGGARFRAIDVSDVRCIEVDFPSDLVRARRLFEKDGR